MSANNQSVSLNRPVTVATTCSPDRPVTAGTGAGRPGFWLKRLFQRARVVPHPDPTEHAGLTVSLALQMELNPPVWLAAGGNSMLPWPVPGYEVKIEPLGLPPEIGSILVFRRGAKLYYHRIVECLGPNRWRTKGDTLIESDEPVSDAEIIGQVTAARRGNRVWAVRPDAGAARLSDRLGRWFGGPGRPERLMLRRMQRLAYLAVLLSAWPVRGRFAQRRSGSGTGKITTSAERN